MILRRRSRFIDTASCGTGYQPRGRNFSILTIGPYGLLGSPRRDSKYLDPTAGLAKGNEFFETVFTSGIEFARVGLRNEAWGRGNL